MRMKSRSKLASDDDLAIVAQRVEQAKAAGIQGVPFFILDNAYARVGRAGAGATPPA